MAFSPNQKNYKTAEDQELISASKKGELSAFDELVLRYQKKVYAIAYQMTGNHSDADDISQEVFLRAYRAIDSFKEGANFYTWIHTIAVHLSINHLKKVGRYSQTSIEDVSESTMIVPNKPSPPQKMENSEFYNQVKKAVDQLSPKYKSVFVLRAFQEMNYEEIANTLRISRGTVMSRLNRARKKLQKLLQKWMVE